MGKSSVVSSGAVLSVAEASSSPLPPPTAPAAVAAAVAAAAVAAESSTSAAAASYSEGKDLGPSPLLKVLAATYILTQLILAFGPYHSSALVFESIVCIFIVTTDSLQGSHGNLAPKAASQVSVSDAVIGVSVIAIAFAAFFLFGFTVGLANLIVLGAWLISQRIVGTLIRAVGETSSRQEHLTRGAAALKPASSALLHIHQQQQQQQSGGPWAAAGARAVLHLTSMLSASPAAAVILARTLLIAVHISLCSNLAPIVLAYSHNALIRVRTCVVHALLSFASVWFWSLVILLQNNRFALSLDARHHGLWLPTPCSKIDSASAAPSAPPAAAWKGDRRYTMGDAVCVDVRKDESSAMGPTVVAYLHSDGAGLRCPPSSEDPLYRLAASSSSSSGSGGMGFVVNSVVLFRRLYFGVIVSGATRGSMFRSSTRTLIHICAALVALAVAVLGFVGIKGPVGISAILLIELIVNASLYVTIS